MQDDKIIFNEAEHTYTNSENGSEYISVTTLLKKYNLSPDYGAIDPQVLAQAAQRGTYVHKCFEEYIKNGIVLDNTITDPFIIYVTSRQIDLKLAKSEQLVYNDQYKIAGTIDFQYEDNGVRIVADFKNTYNIHWDSVTWQLSIYNFITSSDVFDYHSKQIKVFHVRNGFEVRTLPLIPYDEVQKLLEANLIDAPYSYVPDYSAVINTTDAIIYRNVIDEIAQYEAILKSLKEKKEQYEATMIENMNKGNFKKITVNGMAINLVTRKASASWDTKKLEQYLTVHGEVVGDYKKISGKDINYIKTTLISDGTTEGVVDES